MNNNNNNNNQYSHQHHQHYQQHHQQHTQSPNTSQLTSNESTSCDQIKYDSDSSDNKSIKTKSTTNHHKSKKPQQMNPQQFIQYFEKQMKIFDHKQILSSWYTTKRNLYTSKNNNTTKAVIFGTTDVHVNIQINNYQSYFPLEPLSIVQSLPYCSLDRLKQYVVVNYFKDKINMKLSNIVECFTWQKQIINDWHYSLSFIFANILKNYSNDTGEGYLNEQLNSYIKELNRRKLTKRQKDQFISDVQMLINEYEQKIQKVTPGIFEDLSSPKATFQQCIKEGIQMQKKVKKLFVESPVAQEFYHPAMYRYFSFFVGYLKEQEYTNKHRNLQELRIINEITMRVADEIFGFLEDQLSQDHGQLHIQKPQSQKDQQQTTITNLKKTLLKLTMQFFYPNKNNITQKFTITELKKIQDRKKQQYFLLSYYPKKPLKYKNWSQTPELKSLLKIRQFLSSSALMQSTQERKLKKLKLKLLETLNDCFDDFEFDKKYYPKSHIQYLSRPVKSSLSQLNYLSCQAPYDYSYKSLCCLQRINPRQRIPIDCIQRSQQNIVVIDYKPKIDIWQLTKNIIGFLNDDFGGMIFLGLKKTDYWYEVDGMRLNNKSFQALKQKVDNVKASIMPKNHERANQVKIELITVFGQIRHNRPSHESENLVVLRINVRAKSDNENPNINYATGVADGRSFKYVKSQNKSIQINESNSSVLFHQTFNTTPKPEELQDPYYQMVSQYYEQHKIREAQKKPIRNQSTLKSLSHYGDCKIEMNPMLRDECQDIAFIDTSQIVKSAKSGLEIPQNKNSINTALNSVKPNSNSVTHHLPHLKQPQSIVNDTQQNKHMSQLTQQFKHMSLLVIDRNLRKTFCIYMSDQKKQNVFLQRTFKQFNISNKTICCYHDEKFFNLNRDIEKFNAKYNSKAILISVVNSVIIEDMKLNQQWIQWIKETMRNYVNNNNGNDFTASNEKCFKDESFLVFFQYIDRGGGKRGGAKGAKGKGAKSQSSQYYQQHQLVNTYIKVDTPMAAIYLYFMLHSQKFSCKLKKIPTTGDIRPYNDPEVNINNESTDVDGDGSNVNNNVMNYNNENVGVINNSGINNNGYPYYNPNPISMYQNSTTPIQQTTPMYNPNNNQIISSTSLTSSFVTTTTQQQQMIKKYTNMGMYDNNFVNEYLNSNGYYHPNHNNYYQQQQQYHQPYNNNQYYQGFYQQPQPQQPQQQIYNQHPQQPQQQRQQSPRRKNNLNHKSNFLLCFLENIDNNMNVKDNFYDDYEEDDYYGDDYYEDDISDDDDYGDDQDGYDGSVGNNNNNNKNINNNKNKINVKNNNNVNKSYINNNRSNNNSKNQQQQQQRNRNNYHNKGVDNSRQYR